MGKVVLENQTFFRVDVDEQIAAKLAAENA